MSIDSAGDLEALREVGRIRVFVVNPLAPSPPVLCFVAGPPAMEVRDRSLYDVTERDE